VRGGDSAFLESNLGADRRSGPVHPGDDADIDVIVVDSAYSEGAMAALSRAVFASSAGHLYGSKRVCTNQRFEIVFVHCLHTKLHTMRMDHPISRPLPMKLDLSEESIR